MGIELPSELAEIAQVAGVSWPEADEDALRAQAESWRRAAGDLRLLAGDADVCAEQALGALSGPTADAVRQRWSVLGEAESGRLAEAARGAADAADRLEHAAEEVGRAKVELVRKLVETAQTRDAAQVAAEAGHPEAALGVDTVVRQAATDLDGVIRGLADSVVGVSGESGVAALDRPGYAAAEAGVGAAADPGLGEPERNSGIGDVGDVGVGETVERLGAVETIKDLGAGETVEDLGVVEGSDAAGQVSEAGQDTAEALPELIGEAASPAEPGSAEGSDTGPIVLPDAPTPPGGHALGGQLLGGQLLGGGSDAPTPPTGIAAPGGLPYAPQQWGAAPPPAGLPAPEQGQTHLSGFAGAPVAPPPVSPGPYAPQQWGAAAYAPPGPAALPAPPQYGAVPPPFPTAPPGPIGSQPGAPVPGQPPPAPAAPPGQPLRHSAQWNPSYSAASQGSPGQHPVVPHRPPQPVGYAGGPVAAAPAQPAPAQPAPGQPAPAQPASVQPVPGQPPPVASRPPVPQPGAAAVPVGAPRQDRETVAALFVVHMFPIGHLPVPADKPARQLPPSEEDTECGVSRFEPHDHPASAEIDSEHALAMLRDGGRHPAPPPTEVLPCPPPTLVQDHDLCGGLSEADWDRRYLVRDGDRREYAWPPGEPYPEGCHEAGEAVLLSTGAVLDRFGTAHGRVFAADGTAFTQRSLPPAHSQTGYRRYRVRRSLPAWKAVSAPWFGQHGGGVRYRTVYSAAELVVLGYLTDITFEERA